MSLSLKKEKMIEYLESEKARDENFKCMLWGTVYAKLSSFENRSVVSKIMTIKGAPGVAGTLNNAFCYIGMTEKSLYVTALDAYDTSRITATFAMPFANITSLNVRKGLFGGSQTVMIECGEPISLTVKGISLGTDIKDQKERMAEFLTAIEALKGSVPR
ncbi:MAG: hypothetical protein FWF86_01640 [Clostridia bacterium]|nr:hypothetical protein [Clostridia bacterium]